MRPTIKSATILSTALIGLASCGAAPSGEKTAEPSESASEASPQPTGEPFSVAAHGSFNEPWALAIEPGTNRIFITERPGTMKFYDPASDTTGTVTGDLPKVAYAGQGGLGDVAFAPDYATSKAIYLTWAEAGDGDTRGAAMGRGTLNCSSATSCTISDLKVIWRQVPKVTGAGHYSHKIAFSPDGRYLFLSSGERQKGDPAQDLGTNLGKVLRLNLDGSPAAGNPFTDRGGVSAEIWSYGHRNVLGLQFDAQGQLWDLEHGPKGGDEINLVKEGQNYGWPIVSNGVNYDGSPIPDHSTRPEFAAPAISWTPVIAPGDFIFYSGKLWPEWRGQALIPGLATMALVRVSFDGAKGTEQARYPFDRRLRDIVEASDGSVWIAEDGEDGRLLRLTPG
ncbi:dehydrogenase [Altererythrobacter sp. B11]|uniref:PQQ-dependent sugar dehydrogenase n=1 Tax=Altererythrobacter sp. B11 TaxID=2060312 RepID=UPI000DC7014B|nr:PQQ-dependent sugar dehydrogenase [Altererythrobacter sp. B11]BBC73735.1 dehydrogenase [Altererythrobacter sp. B11]